MLGMTSMKTCARCELPKTATDTDFRKSTQSKDGLTSWCRVCFAEYDKERGKTRRKSEKRGRPPKQVTDGKMACSTCKQLKVLLDDFAVDATTPSGRRSRCKACDSTAATTYYEANREKRIANALAWNRANRARYSAIRARSNKRRRSRINAYVRLRRATDMQFRMGLQLRIRLANAVRAQIQGRVGAKRGASAVRDLGCTLAELFVHLESKFAKGMTWENWGMWHIDHVTPISSFDLRDPEQCRRAVHFTNLQPLWELENLIKGDKLPEE